MLLSLPALTLSPKDFAMSSDSRTPAVPTHAVPSYLQADHLGPWGNYLKQVDRVTPYLGHLSRWVETLKRPSAF